jgi:hypothetical protein
MSARPRRAVAERVRRWPEDDRIVWHLYEKADPDADFTEVKCGGGIMFPGDYATVPWNMLCPDCRDGRKTL